MSKAFVIVAATAVVIGCGNVKTRTERADFTTLRGCLDRTAGNEELGNLAYAGGPFSHNRTKPESRTLRAKAEAAVQSCFARSARAKSR